MHMLNRIVCGGLVALVPVALMGGETIGCPKNTEQATLSLDGPVTSTLDCDLLEDKELRKLVEKFAAGTVFAYPDILGTCFSGELSGELTYSGEEGAYVSASATSAQRLFPVPDGIGLFAASKDGTADFNPPPTLQVGAAMTALTMDIRGQTATVLVDDHFLLTEEGDDTEDFLIVGSAGDLRLSGRLVGRGTLAPNLDGSRTIYFSDVSGDVCVATK